MTEARWEVGRGREARRNGNFGVRDAAQREGWLVGRLGGSKERRKGDGWTGGRIEALEQYV